MIYYYCWLVVDSHRTRNIQTQLKELFPDNATELRRYRPSGVEQKKLRLARFKSSQARHISKTHPRSIFKSKEKGKAPAVIPAHNPEIVSGDNTQSMFYDPYYHYDNSMIPSHFTMPQLCDWFVAPLNTIIPNETHFEDERGFSGKIVSAEEEERTIL